MPEEKDIQPDIDHPTPEVMVDEPAGAEAFGAEHGHAVEVGVEDEKVDAGVILGILGITVVIVVAVVAIGFTLAVKKSTEVRDQAAAVAEYPELRELRNEAESLLSQYDASNGDVYRIPIDRAIGLMVNESYEAGEGDFSNELTITTPQ